MSDTAKRVVAGLVALVAIAAVVFLSIRSCNRDSASTRSDSSQSKTTRVTTPGPSDDTTPPAPGASTTTTPAQATASDDDDDSPADDVEDDPAPPAHSGSGGSTSSTPWQRYVSSTKAIVTNNQTDLRATVGDAVAALLANDPAALSAMMAPDEGAGLPDATALADSYPTILRSRTTPTVSIFTVGGATIYFGHAVVDWQDSGILSQHTISVPLRFIDGDWYLSTIDLNTPGLVAVQSVQL